jgi:hypothetical protein
MESANADCNSVEPINVVFTAPVPRAECRLASVPAPDR